MMNSKIAVSRIFRAGARSRGKVQIENPSTEKAFPLGRQPLIIILVVSSPTGWPLPEKRCPLHFWKKFRSAPLYDSTLYSEWSIDSTSCAYIPCTSNSFFQSMVYSLFVGWQDNQRSRSSIIPAP